MVTLRTAVLARSREKKSESTNNKLYTYHTFMHTIHGEHMLFLASRNVIVSLKMVCSFDHSQRSICQKMGSMELRMC